MRLLGGWFTKDTVLPRMGTLERALEPGQQEFERITLHLEDRMGFGVIDPALRKKYERILADVASAIEAAVRENALEVRAVSGER